MNQPTIRYEPMQGLAFDEAGELQRLREFAAAGWQLVGFRGLSYVLEQTSAEEVVFAVDYMHEPDTAYFALCRTSGWAHVATLDKLIHIFKATPGTPPMVSTTETHAKYQRIQRRLLIPAVASLASVVAVWWMVVVWGIPWRAQLAPAWLVIVGNVGLMGIVIAAQTLFMAAFMPWFAYCLHAWRGEGQAVLSGIPMLVSFVTGVLFLWLVI